MQARAIVEHAIQVWEEKMLTLLPPTLRTISSALTFSLNRLTKAVDAIALNLMDLPTLFFTLIHYA